MEAVLDAWTLMESGLMTVWWKRLKIICITTCTWCAGQGRGGAGAEGGGTPGRSPGRPRTAAPSRGYWSHQHGYSHQRYQIITWAGHIAHTLSAQRVYSLFTTPTTTIINISIVVHQVTWCALSPYPLAFITIVFTWWTKFSHHTVGCPGMGGGWLSCVTQPSSPWGSSGRPCCCSPSSRGHTRSSSVSSPRTAPRSWSRWRCAACGGCASRGRGWTVTRGPRKAKLAVSLLSSGSSCRARGGRASATSSPRPDATWSLPAPYKVSKEPFVTEIVCIFHSQTFDVSLLANNLNCFVVTRNISTHYVHINKVVKIMQPIKIYCTCSIKYCNTIDC